MEKYYIFQSPKPTGISQCRLTHSTHFRDIKCMCTHNKISHLKVLQKTTPDELGALASAQCPRTLCLPPTTVLFLQLWNKIHFAGVEGTQNTTGFLIRNEYKISHLKGLQTTTPDGSGAQAFTQCTRTLCVPPTTFLFLRLRKKIPFTGVVDT